MKTTVEISDALMAAARAVAAREGTTVRALIEEGLRMSVERRKRSTAFTLRDASVGGQGLQPGVSFERWADIRELWTPDRDFSRFRDLPIRNPLVE